MNLFTPSTRKNNRMLLTLFLCVVLTALSVSCLAADTVRINGSGSALDMLKPMIETYQKTNRDVRLHIEKPLGSSGAIKALLAGALDIAVTSRALKPEEIAQGGQLREFGRTPLVMVTEKSVQKSNITTKELEEIYSGGTSKWHNGETIRLVLRPREDIDTQILRGLSPGMDKAITASQSRPGMIVTVNDVDAYTTISKTPGGLGASGLTSLLTEKLPLNILSLNGVTPSPMNLASGAYPLFKAISFVTGSRTSPEAHTFITFVFSPQGRAIASKAGVLVTAGKKADK
ncbi:MAG: substrate-binding domain-containing protein [Desulfuromonadales bacterium]